MTLLTKNRKASFEYKFLETYTCGIILLGSEIKSIRRSNVNITHAHCYFKDNELYVKGMHIAEYKESGIHQNHDPLRERKLLLKKKELKHLMKAVLTKGISIIPIALVMTKNNLVKLEIALAQGKKLHDKREAIKLKDMERETQRKLK